LRDLKVGVLRVPEKLLPASGSQEVMNRIKVTPYCLNLYQFILWENAMSRIDNSKPAARTAAARIVFLVLALLLILSLSTTPAYAKATTFTMNFSEETDVYVYIPCALDGAGEDVYLSGPLHMLFTTIIADSGAFVSRNLFQPQGITGTGASSGDRYQATGETQDMATGRVGYETTYVNNFKIIGQGSGNNYMVHENVHMTVTPDGTLTAYVDNFSVECQ
jgi:hypothetical protein